MYLTRHLKLEIPFEEKDEARALGARPFYKDEKFVCWFVEKGANVLPFARWWNQDFAAMVMSGSLDVPAEDLAQAQAALTQGVSMASTAPTASAGVAQPGADASGQSGGVTLSSYLTQVKQVVTRAFGTATWVVADVVNITGQTHRYLELAEYDERGSEVAKSRGMLWARDANILLRRFEASTGMPLKGGMKVLVQVKPQVSERYGLSLKIENIDPRFTLGEMEAKIQRIRQQLQAEGAMTQKGRLFLPPSFERVAVIAPDGAAGLGDFNTQADVLQGIGLCQFTHFAALFQGNHAKASLVKAFAEVEAQQAAGAGFDAIVIIRGGGDTAGLMALNELEIVRAVCQASLPVMVGIGHERDTTLLDEYGAQRFATPSMVIGHIVRSWVEHGEAVKTLRFQMQQCVGDTLVRVREGLLSQRQRVADTLQAELRRTRERLVMSREQMQRDNLQALSQLRHVLRGKRHEIAGVSPSRILSMGYGYVIEGPGKTLPNAKVISEHSTAILRMQDGDVPITISKTEGA